MNLGLTNALLDDFDTRRPPPTGYKPLRACTFCPPGGLYFDFIMWAVHFPLNFVQLGTFLVHADYFFFSVGVVDMAVYIGVLVREYGVKFPIHVKDEMIRSITIGRHSDHFRGCLAVKSQLEAPVFGLVVPYGMMLNRNLSPFQCIVAWGSLLLNMKNLASFDFQYECCGAAEQVAAVAWKKATIGLSWSAVRTCFELSFFAIVCAVLHPLIIVPFYIAQAATMTYIQGKHLSLPLKSCEDYFFLAISIFSINMNWGVVSSTMCLPFPSHEKFAPARCMLIATLCRISLIASMVFGFDLPKGLVDIGSLGRPMGWMHFQAEQLTFGASFFQDVMLLMCGVMFPIYILGTMCLLTCHVAYCRGEVDTDLLEKLDQKLAEVDAWEEGRERAYASCA